jgi:hypothetical protein
MPVPMTEVTIHDECMICKCINANDCSTFKETNFLECSVARGNPGAIDNCCLIR